jgi:hypothetical protein
MNHTEILRCTTFWNRQKDILQYWKKLLLVILLFMDLHTSSMNAKLWYAYFNVHNIFLILIYYLVYNPFGSYAKVFGTTSTIFQYTSQSVGSALTKLVVIGTDCIDSWKSNYHKTTTTTTTPHRILVDPWPWSFDTWAENEGTYIIILSVLLWFTASEYPIYIVTLFLIRSFNEEKLLLL